MSIQRLLPPFLPPLLVYLESSRSLLQFMYLSFFLKMPCFRCTNPFPKNELAILLWRVKLLIETNKVRFWVLAILNFIVYQIKLQTFWKKRNLSKKAAVQFKNDALKMRFDCGKLRNIIKFKKRASQPIWETLKQLFSRKTNFFLEFFEMGKKMMSRHEISA